jgi:hypothetical protein
LPKYAGTRQKLDMVFDPSSERKGNFDLDIVWWNPR